MGQIEPFFHPHSNQRDRYSLMQVVAIDLSTTTYRLLLVYNRNILWFMVNTRSLGLCLLVNWSTKLGEMLRVQAPWSTGGAKTPTPLCANVRWVRRLPFEGNR